MPGYPSLLFYGVLLAWTTGLLVSAWALGGAGLKLLGFSRPPARGSVINLGAGLAVLSYVGYGLATSGLLSHALLFVITWFFSAIGVCGIAGACFALASGKLRLRRQTGEVILALVLGTYAFFNLMSVLTPEIGWDGLAYHLALPKLYLSAGGYYFKPDIFHNLFPQFVENLFLLGLVFPYGLGAKVIHFLFGLLAAVSLYSLGAQTNHRTAGIVAALFFYAQYLIHLESGTAFVDLATSAYMALAMLATAAYLMKPESERDRWLYLAIFFIGINAAIKWHGLILLGLAGALALFEIGRAPRSGWAVKTRKICLVIGIGALPVIPYFLRAALAAGNPVWPLAYGVFGGAHWDAEQARGISELVRGFAGVRHDLIGYFMLPIDMIFRGARFGVGGAELRWPLVGLAFLGFIGILRARPSCALLPPRWKRVWLPAIALFAFLAIWYGSSQQIRFLLPVFPLVAWGAALGVVEIWKRGQRRDRWLAICISLFFFLFHPPLHRDTPQQVKTILGLENAEMYCSQKLKHYSACQWLNQQVAPGEKVLLFGENRGFYLDVDYVWGDPVLQKVIDYRALPTPESLAERLGELGVRWVLYRTDLYPETYLNPGIVAQMRECLAQRGTLQREFGEVGVFRLSVTNKQNPD